MTRVKTILSAAIVVVTLAMFDWYYVIGPWLIAGSAAPPRRLIELVSPVGDMLLIWALIRTYFAASRQVARAPIVMLIAGVGLSVAANIGYIHLNTYGLYALLPLDEIAWVLAAVTISSAALAQHRALRSSPLSPPGQAGIAPPPAADLWRIGRAEQFAPYLAVVAAMMLMLIGMPRAPSEVRWGLIAGMIASIFIVLIRQMVSIVETVRLNEKLRAFSRELEQRVAERTAELAHKVEEVTHLNQQLQQANEELRQMDRLKQEFISNVSHELRTPLTVILGHAELLLDSPEEPLSPFQNESLQTIFSNGQRLLGLVNDLLDMSRLESGRFAIHPTPVEPAPLLRRLVEENRTQASNKGLELEANLPDSLPALSADGPRIAQVVNNLLSNAIKFTPRGGKVDIRAYALEGGDGNIGPLPSGVYAPAAELPPGNWIVVCVQDTGMGIPAEELPQLFSRFYRTSGAQHQAIKGTGLGLYVSKGIIEAHHGRIGVVSQPGQGSTFWFALPIQQAQTLRPGLNGSHPSAPGEDAAETTETALPLGASGPGPLE